MTNIEETKNKQKYIVALHFVSALFLFISLAFSLDLVSFVK